MSDEAHEKKQMDMVVHGHAKTQTKDANWLCLENIYQKFNRPNFYDIGGTYIGDVADYWFSYNTDIIGKTYVLQLFVLNHQDTSFTLGISHNNFVDQDNNGVIYLTQSMKEYSFVNVGEKVPQYVVTYSFSQFDVGRLKDKKLYIHIKIQQYNNREILPEQLCQVKACHDLGALLKDPIYSDFTIESADGHKFKVHKYILTTQSEVFNAMLRENTAESQNNYVKLMDVNKDELMSILQFFYTGTIHDIANCNYSNLLMLADKYDLKGVFETAQHALYQQLSVDTALETLMIADMYNSLYLKTAALTMIKENLLALKTPVWNEFKNPELMRELCEFMVPCEK